MRQAARTLLILYAATCVLFGVAWLIGPELMAPRDLGLSPADMPPKSWASLMVQLRFGGALEIAFGWLLWDLRDSAVERGDVNRFAFQLMLLLPLARVAAIAIHGMPHWGPWIATWGELAGALVFFGLSRSLRHDA